MIPLLVLALAGVAALAAYEFSPKAHAWVDEHVHALAAAHRAADEYLASSKSASDPATGARHAADAHAANRAAAGRTADAASIAGTDQQRATTSTSAQAVTERDQKIAAAMAALGVGQCGVHVYEHVPPQKKDALIAKLHAEGMDVVGDNPWDIETHEHGVKLRAVWDPQAQVLRLIVTAGEGGYAGLVTCDRIWEKIDPIVKGIVGA